MARDTFEVYYNQNGRWQLHTSYEASQRDLAIEEAKTVEQKEGYATRVVRETVKPDNTTEEVITWQSPKAKNINDADNMFGVAVPQAKSAAKGSRKAPAPRPPAQAKVSAATPAPEKKSTPQKSAAFQPAPLRNGAKKARPKKKQRGVLTRLIFVLASGAGIAVACATALVGVLYGLIEFGILSRGADRTALVAGTFVLVFFLAILVNLQKQFNVLSALRSKPSQTKRAPGPEQMMAVTAKRKPAQDVEFDQVDIQDLREKVLAEDVAVDSAAEDAALDSEDQPASLDADMGTSFGSEAAPEPKAPNPTPQSAPLAQAPPAVQQDPRRDPPPTPKIEEKKAPASAQVSPAENEARTGMQRFVSDALRYVTGDLNAFSRFGFNLYIAGAGSVIGQSKRLGRDVQLSVLKQGLQASGMPADRAESFCVELPHHGKNPKYAGMIQSGMKAMQEYLAGNTNIPAQVAPLLQEWNLPEKRAAIPSIITFVFTDIVGSTAMTQRLGNAGAQKAVRAHNNAVRSAIQAYKGREVKHTGDGIMATFPDPPSAVAACIKMQREIAAHNTQNRSIEVSVRIGINAGEAVQEENDFFGAAVQMTARICDKASTGNIWVSQAVVDACKGQKFGFIPRGAFEMKGIQGSKRLFEVGWSDAHRNELADL
jgi:adenylate cyclase